MSFISGAAGALIGGLSNLFTQNRQMKHDKEMAALNQKYALEQMSQQNDYQVEQWNRENEYNDPSNVKHRYEAAGISPYAVFGNSAASGAGIAGGLSSAPSGSSTGHSSTLSSVAGGLSNSITQAGIAAEKLIEEKRYNNANIANTNAQTSAQLIDNLTKGEQNLLNLESTRSEIVANLAKANLSDSERAVDKKRLEQIDASIASTRETINLIKKQIDTEDARAKNISAQTAKTNQETKILDYKQQWQEKYGFPVGSNWSQVLASLYVRGKNTEEKISDLLQSKFGPFFKSLFESNNEKIPTKDIVDIVSSDDSPAEKQEKVKKVLKKSDYNWYNE